MILKSETFNFHRFDLTRQGGFIVTVYDEAGLRKSTARLFLIRDILDQRHEAAPQFCVRNFPKSSDQRNSVL